MSTESLAKLHSKLDEYEARLVATEKRITEDDGIADLTEAHRAEGGKLREKARTVREKMPADEGSVWDAVQNEIRRDVDALVGDFRHWIDYLDGEYRKD